MLAKAGKPLLLQLLLLGLPALASARELPEAAPGAFSCIGCLIPAPATDLPSSRDGGRKVPPARAKEGKGFEPGAYFDLGTAVLAVGDDHKLLGDIIALRGVLPVAGPYLGVTFGMNLTWGLSEFSHDESFALGLNSYPFGKYVSLHAEGLLGSFFLNNLTLMATGGLDVDVPLGGDGAVSLFLGPEVGYRRVHEVAGFVSDRAWYLSGQCLGGRLGIRFGSGGERRRGAQQEGPDGPPPAAQAPEPAAGS